VELLGLFASRNVDPWTILETFTLSLGWIFALTFPMAVLVAVVMAFGRLSQDFELDAFHAGGVSFLRLLVPTVLATVVLSGLLVLYNNHVLPDANHRLKTLMADIHKMKPTIAIREGVFMDDFEGYRLLVREVDDVSNELHDVTIYVVDPREPVRTIHAPRGELVSENDGNRLVIRLFDGEIHETDPEEPGNYMLLDFQTHELIFGDLGTRLERRGEGLSRGDRELSAGDMRERVAEFQKERSAQSDSLEATVRDGLQELRALVHAAVETEGPKAVRPAEFISRTRILVRNLRNAERRIARKDRDIHRYQVEIHKKYSFPAACVVFALIGAPLGAMVRRGGAGVGGGLSFAFFLLYYVASLGGEKLGDRGLVSPAAGMWGIDVLLGLVGLALVFRRDSRWPLGKARRP
jgi:lipopolysaccharide export system permease protein